jgi:hypothetical protein
MEKQDIPLNSEKEIDEKIKKVYNLPYQVFGSLFWAYLFVSVAFSLFSSIVSLYFLGFTQVSFLGVIIFKFWLFFWSCFVSTIVLMKVHRYIFKKNLKFEERRKQIKKELKGEILGEINGKNRRE